MLWLIVRVVYDQLVVGEHSIDPSYVLLDLLKDLRVQILSFLDVRQFGL